MTNEQLEALAVRVESLQGPDREVDAEIAVAASAVPSQMEKAFVPYCWRGIYDDRYWRAPEYTASLDAALTLVPEGLSWALYSDGSCEIGKEPNSGCMMEGEFDGDGATPAHALTASALRARKTT